MTVKLTSMKKATYGLLSKKIQLLLVTGILFSMFILGPSAYAVNNATFTYNWNDTGSTTNTLNLTGEQGSQVHNITTSQTFKLETGKTANAGQIVLTYPRYILEERSGTGYAQAQLTLPDAPGKVPENGSFYYYFSGNDLIITNTKTVTAGTALSFEILYSGNLTNLPVNYSKTFTAKCSVNGELLSPAPSLTLVINKPSDANTIAAYTNVNKFSTDKTDTWNSSWGVKPALPGGVDADYVYIDFYILITNTTGLLVQSASYTETTKNNGVIVAWGKYTAATKITYYQNDFNTNSSFSASNPSEINTTRRVVVRYKKSDLTVSGGNYSGYNNITVVYQLEQGAVQTRTQSYNFHFQELSFVYQGDAFNINKSFASNVLTLSKPLFNDLLSEQVAFHISADSKGYALTEGGNTAYTISLVDDMIYLDATRLTPADYFIEEMSFPFSRTYGGSAYEGYVQRTVNTTTGKESDDAVSANYPPVDVYTRNNDNSVWLKFGSYKITNTNEGTFTPVSTGKAQIIYSDTRISLPANVTQIKYELSSKAYRTAIQPSIYVRLKPSATVKNIITNNPIASIDNVGTLIIKDKNGNHRNPADESTIHGSNKQAIIDHDKALYEGNIAQHANVQVRFFPRVPTRTHLYKIAQPTATEDNSNQRYFADYSMSYANVSLMPASAVDFSESTDEQKDGIFYDLLPMGMTVDINSVKAWLYDPKIDDIYFTSYLTNPNAIPATVNVSFVENWKNSGRTMMKIHVTTTNNLIFDNSGYINSGFMVEYRAYYPYTAVKDYGTHPRNSFVYYSNSGEVANLHKGEPNTYPPAWGFFDTDYAYNDLPIFGGDGSNVAETEIDAGWWTDIDGNGNPAGRPWNTTLPKYEERDLNFKPMPMASESGLTKKVKPSSSTLYSYNGTIWPNDTYNYQLRYSNAGTETTANLILYDKIESANGSNPAFKGTLLSVNTAHPTAKGINPVVYYSIVAAIDLNEPTHRNLANAAYWTSIAPVNPAAVTAVAVDLTKKTNGTAYTLPAGEAVVIEINMKAPALMSNMTGKKAYNVGFATGTSTLNTLPMNTPATVLTPGTPATAILTGAVTLNGTSTMDANQFRFKLTELPGNNNANYTGITFTSGQSPVVTAAGSGAIDFGTLSFLDVGTYKFAASELPGRVDGINKGYTFDNAPDTIKIVISKVENALIVESITTSKNNASTSGSAGFANFKILAVDDVITAKPGVPVDIPVTANDELLAGAVTVVIHGSPDELPGNQLAGPAHGTATVKPNNEITYTPNNNTWEGIDEFEYEIYYSNYGIRERAKVYVLVMEDDHITCEDTKSINLQSILPAGSNYEWYDAATNGVKLAGNPLIVSRNDDVYYVEQWLALNYIPAGKTSNIFPDRIKMRVRFVPKTMYWKTNAQNSDWNDPENWNGMKNEALDKTLKLVPFQCTTVHIPGNATANYPSLEISETNRITFNGNTGNEPVCDSIYFHFGGEVAKPHYLAYNKALVELILKANRWYMLSAPLQGMFPGDYYIDDPNPLKDGYLFYTRLFAQNNPQTGQEDKQTVNIDAGWTGTFNTPDVPMPTGFGFSVWMDDGTPVEDQNPSTMWFPKHDNSYNIYNKNTGEIMESIPLTRVKEHRFIFEPGLTKETGELSFFINGTSETATAIDKHYIVGNPFMAHWQFDSFRAQNSGKIADEYKILKDGDAAFTTWKPDVQNGLTNRIAPMQSILVKASSSFTSLEANANHTEIVRGDKLRSSNGNSGLLSIVAKMGDKQNSTAVLFNVSADNNYEVEEDSHMLFVKAITEPVAVYTRSADGYALDINCFGDCTQPVPVGIRTSLTGTITLQFKGMENFLPGYDVFLIDTKNSNAKINLREKPEYSFEKTTSDLFLDGRLYLSFNKVMTGISTPEDGAAAVFMNDNQLQVICNNTIIKEVQVTDMSGRTILRDTNINNTLYTRNLPKNNIYVVKVLTEDGVIVRKVTSNK